MSLFKKIYGYERSEAGKSLDRLMLQLIVVAVVSTAIHYWTHISWGRSIVGVILAIIAVSVLIGLWQGMAIRAEQKELIDKFKRGEPEP